MRNIDRSNPLASRLHGRCGGRRLDHNQEDPLAVRGSEVHLERVSDLEPIARLDAPVLGSCHHHATFNEG